LSQIVASGWPFDDPPVLTVLYGMGVDESVRARLEDVLPAIEVQHVPYFEDHELRNARMAGFVTDELRARAPRLTDDQWAILERTTMAVAVDLPDGFLARAGSLRWVQTMSAGTNHLDAERLASAGVVLTNGAGLVSANIAEFVMARLLQVWKQFRWIEANQEARRWEHVPSGEVAGRTLGIVGLGAIGRATAKRARPFDIRVLATRRTAVRGTNDPDVDKLYTTDELDVMLAQCDAVVLSAPATPQTVGLFDRRRIETMRTGAVLCNVARGSLVDEDALVEALRSGHLGAAVLDATVHEPLPSDSPLWTAPNCYVSSHNASAGGGGYTRRLLDLVVRNLERFMRGDDLENLVIARPVR
jgi:phosphoglycerate dehydrogenase-like enzyme